jgi:hypothetical protein
LVCNQSHIYRIPAQTFLKTSQSAPFGWIQHRYGSKMNAPERFWIAVRLPDGLNSVENEKKGCFMEGIDKIPHRKQI